MIRATGADEYTDNPFNLQFETFDHPAMAYFEDPKVRPGVTRMPVYKFIETELPETQDGTRVLASFHHAKTASDGAKSYPAIIEKRFGKGRVVMFTTSADKSWNLYGATPAFVPLMKEMAYEATQRSLRSNLLVGESLNERFPPQVTKVLVVMGDGVPLERSTSQSGDRTAAEVMIPRIEKEMLIRIEAADDSFSTDPSDTKRLVAVNVDPSESDLTRAENAWLTLHFGTELLQVVSELDEIGESNQEGDNAGVWKALLYAVLAFLVVETVMAQRFGRNLRAEGMGT